VAVVVVIIAAAVAGWWFFLRTDPGYLDISKLNSQDTHVAKAQQYAKQSLPSKSEDLAMRYGLIAAYLYAGKEYTYSEHYYLTAQKTVEQRKLNQKDYRFYQGLSDTYEKLGNKAKAEQYKQKEKDAIKVNYSAKEIQQMEEMKLNGRSR